MKSLRLIASSVLVVALASGCQLISGQYTVAVEMPTPLDANSVTVIDFAQVNLTLNREYRDHRGKIRGLVDCALLGKFTNTGTGALGVVVYMTPDLTQYSTKSQLDADATKIQLWGPLNLAAGASRTVGWDESSRLFSAAGKQALTREVKGDGQFTIYVVGSTAPYQLRLENGVAVVVIDAGS